MSKPILRFATGLLFLACLSSAARAQMGGHMGDMGGMGQDHMGRMHDMMMQHMQNAMHQANQMSQCMQQQMQEHQGQMMEHHGMMQDCMDNMGPMPMSMEEHHRMMQDREFMHDPDMRHPMEPMCQTMGGMPKSMRGTLQGVDQGAEPKARR